MSEIPRGPVLSASAPDARRRMSNAALLWRMLKISADYRWQMILVLLLQSLLVVLTMSTLGLTGLGIDFLRSQLQPDAGSLRWPGGVAPPEHWPPQRVIAVLSAMILAVAVVTAALKYGAALASAALSQRILIRIRTDVYQKLQQLSFHFYDAGESSSIINRAAGDASAVRNFVDGVVVRVLTVSLTLGVYLVYMLRVHVLLTICCLVSTPVLWIGAVMFSRRVQPVYRRASELGDVMIRTLVESLQGIHVVKGFAREPEQIEKFRKANAEIREVKQSIFNRVSVFQPAMGLVTQLNMLILIGYGGALVVRGELALGSGLFVFANLLHDFAGQVGQITNIANSIQSSLVSAERVFEVLDEPIRIQSVSGALPLSSVRGEIEFDRVCFGYLPERPILHDVSFHVAPGQSLGITGPTGSGKSTLLNLLMRFYDVTSGVIRVDGVDIRQVRLSDLRASMGLVFQDSFLFSNTIASNIAFGFPDATLDEIRCAASIAAADDFIDALPDGYQSMVGEHGANLSGGQRQRLAMARALIRHPPVLLLDDATSSVDPETEHEIRTAILSAMQARTTIVVSNRISTLRRLDRIIVLNDGRIVGEGTHEELMKSCPGYRQLADLQFSDFAFEVQAAEGAIQVNN